MAEIVKIVLTGGPCGGKSTAKKFIENFCDRHGIKLVFVPESATEILRDKTLQRGSRDFQKKVYENQLKNEEIAVQSISGKTLIVCDRGTVDSAAYYRDGSFEELLKGYNSNLVSERDRYDAVFHLESAACGAEEYYTNAGGHRTETLEEARTLDEKTLSVWVGHNHLRVIKNGVPFEEKMQNLIDEIAFFMGIPQPLEIEKKFLIKKPDEQHLKCMPLCRGTEIVQAYLKGNGRRIRKRGSEGAYSYYYTEKRKLSGGVREEIEKKISAEEFDILMKEADESCLPIEKIRYCLVYEGKYFEIDLFPFMQETALMEIELKSVDEKFMVPPFARVLEEVTDNPEYTNHALAKKLKNM